MSDYSHQVYHFVCFDWQRKMSSEEPVFNGGILNLGVDDDNADEIKDVSNSGSTPRFRISKLSTDQELQEIKVVDDTTIDVESDIIAQNSDSIQSKPEGKHVHMNLPADYNDTSHHRNTQTQTLGYLTHDAVPLSVFYRNQASMENVAGDKRPTLDLLHEGKGLENAKKRHWVSETFLSESKM